MKLKQENQNVQLYKYVSKPPKRDLKNAIIFDCLLFTLHTLLYFAFSSVTSPFSFVLLHLICSAVVCQASNLLCTVFFSGLYFLARLFLCLSFSLSTHLIAKKLSIIAVINTMELSWWQWRSQDIAPGKWVKEKQLRLPNNESSNFFKYNKEIWEKERRVYLWTQQLNNWWRLLSIFPQTAPFYKYRLYTRVQLVHQWKFLRSFGSEQNLK